MEIVDILQRSIDAAVRNDREDLARRLQQARLRLEASDVQVLVAGEFKQGKSQLVNALVGAPICPVDDDIATSVPTTVRYAPSPTASTIAPRGGSASVDSADLVHTPVEFSAIPEVASERGNPGNRLGLFGVEVGIPSEVLRGGIRLVDSPGVGGVRNAATLASLDALTRAHAVIFVSDATQEFTDSELRFLSTALRVCPNVSVALTKIDLAPQWRQIRDLDRAHLDRAGLQQVPILPVSAVLRIARMHERAAGPDPESGFDELIEHLRTDVHGQWMRLTRRGIAQDLHVVAQHLSIGIAAELAALTNPDAPPLALEQLEEARERAERLRKFAATWQVTLNDGINDLLADLDYDLRDRLRRLQREAEESIDSGDPGPVWPQFVEWLEERTASAIADTFLWTKDRAQWLTEQVAEHFEQEAVTVPALDVGRTSGVLDPVGEVGHIDSGHLSALQKMIVSMRGSYGGVLMVGLATGLMGLSLINPISLAAGVLLGGKAFVDDRKVRLERRQNEAKMVIRKHFDDVLFQVAKQLKDRIRFVQRSVRDHFTGVAEEYHRTISAALQALKQSSGQFQAETAERVTTLRSELESTRWIAAAADAVAPAGEKAAELSGLRAELAANPS